MADVTVGDAAAQFLTGMKGAARQQAMAELNRFSRWYGPGRPVTGLRGHDIASYGEAMGPATLETQRRAEQLRAFLLFLQKEGILDHNLASHLRLRKSARTTSLQHGEPAAAVELTQDGVDSLRTELESLMGERIAVREEIRKAMLDKDFRENAPLDAAKDKQGHIEARIREIDAMLKRAVIVALAGTGRVRVGCTVRVKNTVNGKVTEYAIVGPTEANAAEGKISSVSPVGKALLDGVPGDEVEISVPAGTMRLVIEAVQG